MAKSTIKIVKKSRSDEEDVIGSVHLIPMSDTEDRTVTVKKSEYFYVTDQDGDSTFSITRLPVDLVRAMLGLG
jgi:hypothetical protein